MALQNFELCDQPGVFVAVNIGSATVVTGETYSIINPGTGSIYCASVASGLPAGPPYDLGMLFDSCFDCLETTSPVTANTIQEICVQVCEPISGGTTVVSVDPPHPVWTGLYGNSVTQGNASTLGGVNGLNA